MNKLIWLITGACILVSVNVHASRTVDVADSLSSRQKGEPPNEQLSWFADICLEIEFERKIKVIPLEDLEFGSGHYSCGNTPRYKETVEKAYHHLASDCGGYAKDAWGCLIYGWKPRECSNNPPNCRYPREPKCDIYSGKWLCKATRSG